MLNGHRVLKIKSQAGDNIEVEINFSDNEKVKDAKILRFKIDGKQYDIKKDELVSLMMVVGTIDDQKKLMPMKLTNIRKIERLLTFEWKTTRSYREGEVIQVKAPWIDEVPNVEEVFAGNIKKKKGKALNFFVK